MWQNLNKVMANNGVPNPNFKGFMANNLRLVGMLFELSMVAEMKVS
jgi:hypothetical protein